MISLTGNKEGVEHVDVSDTKRRTRTIWSRYFSSSFRDVNAGHNILEAGRRLRPGDASKTTSVASVAITAESHVL
jgi:hypothetical protein